MKLEIGYNHTFEIRKEIYVSNCNDNFSILYLSDLHLNKYCNNISLKIISAIQELDPTIVLFGGDYVDTKNGLLFLKKILNSLSQRENVFAIAGNHDFFYGIEEIKKTMLSENVIWLEKGSTFIDFGNTRIRLDGNNVENQLDNSDFSILFLHKPKDLTQFAESYNIAFAGHLHGSQFVFWKSKHKLYPGRWFYKWNILQMKLKKCHYYISKGLGDTLPIRFNCKKDIIFVQVINKKI